MEKEHLEEEGRAKKAWNNKFIPVVIRRGGSRALRLRVPATQHIEVLLRNGSRKRKPLWVPEGTYWELPASRFNDVVKLLLSRFGNLYIIQPYRENEICARACMEAHGFECQCSCMGAHHGSAHCGGWYEVYETFSVRYGETRLACRLLIANKGPT